MTTHITRLGTCMKIAGSGHEGNNQPHVRNDSCWGWRPITGSIRETLKQQVLHEIVRAVSQLGTCKRSKVGAIIVRDGRVIATGYNGSPPGEPHCLDVGCDMQNGHCVRCTHAEANAIAWAARYGIKVEGASIYVTGWTTGGGLGICPACEKLSKSAGITSTIIVPKEAS